MDEDEGGTHTTYEKLLNQIKSEIKFRSDLMLLLLLLLPPVIFNLKRSHATVK